MKKPSQHEPEEFIRPEYSLSPDDDLYGSPRSWSGFQSKMGSSSERSSDRFTKKNKRRSRNRRDNFRAQAVHESENLLTQRFVIQSIGAITLFFAVWMFFHSQRPLAHEVQNSIKNVMRVDYSTIALPPALARNFGALPSSAVTVLSTQTPKITFVRPMSGTVIRTYTLVNPDVLIQGRPGSHVVASADGLVTRVGESQANGQFLVIDHGSHGQTFYAHLGSVFVHTQEYVTAGQIIGMLPLSGKDLTFGYIQKGVYRNPLVLFKQVK